LSDQIYYGPRGGKWEDPEHTRPYHDRSDKPGDVVQALMGRASRLLQYADEDEAVRRLLDDGYTKDQAYLAVKAGKLLNRFRQQRSKPVEKSKGPFQQKMEEVLKQVHPLLPEANGELADYGNPKHAPGVGWLPVNDGTGGWFRRSSKGTDLFDVWYPEHDQIIDIGRAAKLPDKKEYMIPSLCGTMQIEMIENRRQVEYAKQNEDVAVSSGFNVVRVESVLAISKLQKVIAGYHKQNFERMLAVKRTQSSILGPPRPF